MNPIFPFHPSSWSTADTYDFRVVAATEISDGAFRIVADPEDASDPCNTFKNDLTGSVTVSPTDGWEAFSAMDV